MKPLDVFCPTCYRVPTHPCVVMQRWGDSVVGFFLAPTTKRRDKPHAARVRAAQAQEKKEGDRG